MRFEGKTVLAIHEGQTDTVMVRGHRSQNAPRCGSPVRC